MRLAPFLLVTLLAAPAAARDLHAAPGGSGDGSEASPMALDAALAAAADGDHVLLQDGDWGDVVLSGEHDADTFVEPAPGHAPRLRTLVLRNARHLVARGLSISLSYGDPYANDTLVSIQGSAVDVTVEDCDVFSVTDEVSDAWDATQWADLPGTGISVRASNATLRNNRVRNVGYGISVGDDAPNATVIGNSVDRFSRDGLRGIGDYGRFENNVVRDAYDVDDHHDDFFQSWSVGPDGVGTGVVRGVVLRGNLFINFTDPDRPFAGAAQGIGCFDGFFEDWVIENNVVVVNHWHGITLLGARNVRIVNNTVVDNRLGESPGPPWIDVSAHKDGTPSENILIRNNLVQTVTLEAMTSTEDHNLRFTDPSALFVDVPGFDFHLLDDAEAIDMGIADMAPLFDRDSIPRPQGMAFDLGAYEWHDGTVAPADAGPPGEDAGTPSASDGGSPPPGTDGGGTMAGTDAGAAGDPGSDGCGCRVGGGDARGGLALLLVGLGLAIRRRRR